MNPIEMKHRRSIRLKGYDYKQAGAYFVTICTRDRECLFGDVTDCEMRLKRHWTESAGGVGSIAHKVC